MAGSLLDRVSCWIAWGGIDERFAPEPALLEQRVSRGTGIRAGRVPIRARSPTGRSGTVISLPHGLQAWLRLSNGLFGGGPFIHPITAIGPMIPFARVPEMIVQPESWFELGNPNRADDLHRPGLSLAGRRLSDLHFRRRRVGQPAADHRAELRGVVSRAVAARGAGNTGSIRGSGILATPGSRIAGTSRSRPCRPRLDSFADRVARLHGSGRRRAQDRREPGARLAADVESIFRHFSISTPDRVSSGCRLRAPQRSANFRMTAGWFLTYHEIPEVVQGVARPAGRARSRSAAAATWRT